jgi:voltage-gated potassium channel Kch
MLAVIMVVYVLIIVITSPQLGGSLRVAILGYLLYQTVRSRRRAGKWVWPAIALSLVLVGLTIWAAIAGSDVALICIASSATALLVVAVMVVIAKPLLATRVVDGPAVRGVLCVYLLFALLFASFYQFFGALISPFLNGVSGHPTASDTLYFSVITLATVGYGDITPESSLARALVVAEALLGQLYLVSIVAAVVSRYRREDV